MNETDERAAQDFGDALVTEIWLEMARHGMRSVRALAKRMGTANHTSLNDRLNKSSRTGQRVAIGGEDLYLISVTLGVWPDEMVRRARLTATTRGEPHDPDMAAYQAGRQAAVDEGQADTPDESRQA